MTLWLPFLDHAMNYKAWTAELKQIIGNEKCVAFSKLDRHQIAGFSFHGNIAFMQMQNDTPCNWLLSKPHTNDSGTIKVDSAKWHFVKTIQRPGDKRDTVQIYQRIESFQHD
jgi:hypothetical protein